MRFRGTRAGLTLVMSILVACTGDPGDARAPSPSITTPTPAVSPTAGTVTVKVRGIEGEQGSELAGVLFRGDGTYPDRSGVGGFSLVIDSDPFSTTQIVHHGDPSRDDPDLSLPFPFVSGEVATVEPGTYTFALWVAPKLGPYSRWVPASSPGLEACQTRLLVQEGLAAVVKISGAALRPEPFRAHLPWCGTMRVSVSVSGIQGEAGGRLAGILFEGRETSYPDFHPVGGFAASVNADPFSTTQTVRQPAPNGSGGRFPFVTDAVLHVSPGTYTIALYVGPELRPIPYSHWRPWGTAGLRGCKMVLVVEDGKGSTIVRMHDPALAEWSGDRGDRWAPWHEHPPSCLGT